MSSTRLVSSALFQAVEGDRVVGGGGSRAVGEQQAADAFEQSFGPELLAGGASALDQPVGIHQQRPAGIDVDLDGLPRRVGQDAQRHTAAAPVDQETSSSV
jgi:hypothetical protein